MPRKKADPETKPEKKAAPKKKAKQKTEPQYEWLTGKPERGGLYNARVEGREMPLQFKICPFTRRSYWLHVDGSDVDPNAKVEWRKGKIFLE